MIEGNLDFPKKKWHGLGDSIDIYGNAINANGWAFSTSGEEIKIKFYLDDNLIGECETGMPRWDVSKSFESNEQSYESGFMHRLDLSSYDEKIRKLKVVAESDLEKKILDELNVKIKPGTPPPVLSQEHYKHDSHIFLEYFKNLGELKAHEKVLEVGCGIGRLALGLTRFLEKSSGYDGFDVNKQVIDYCKSHITPKFPNFKFSFVNLDNTLYNRGGSGDSAKYKFPYNNESYDFIILNSVFTHLLPDAVENYLSEITRVLKKGGRCFITYHLLNEESLQFSNSKSIILDFKYNYENYRVIDKDIPENAVAYDEEYIKNLYQNVNLHISKIDYGIWCVEEKILKSESSINDDGEKNRRKSKHTQDFIIATKI